MILVAAMVSTLTLRSEPSRVAAAMLRFQATNQTICRKLGVAYPPHALYIKAFKSEQKLELWGGNAGAPMMLLGRFDIQYVPGDIGPKRAEGDNQVPEGFYSLTQFNPYSKFKLSLKVSYPNPLDKARAVGAPGGDIFIHGGDQSIGCLPIGDSGIEQLYTFCWASKQAWKIAIPVHIFPCKLTPETWNRLSKTYAKRRDLMEVWKPLWQAENLFLVKRRPPRISFAKGGAVKVS